jgi:DNA-binding IclR family transcriptional regulator
MMTNEAIIAKRLAVLPQQPNQSLIDGIRCLQAIVSHEAPVGVVQLGRELGIETTRVNRFLRTLSHIGLLQRNAQRKYHGGPALSVLATQTLHAIGFGRRAIPPLERLRKKTRKIVAMGVLWELSVSYLYHAFPGNRLEMAIGSYEIWPATQSGIGMVLLSQLPDREIRARFSKGTKKYAGGVRGLLKEMARIRSQGYACVSTWEANRTLALPLASNPYTAIGISGTISPREIPFLLAELRKCIAEVDAGKKGTSREAS